jgi:hypothetical protein
MRGKKKMAPSKGATTKTLYFGPEVQDSMDRYHTQACDKKKEEIYVKEIFPAFNKLVENLIYIYGFGKGASFNELKSDCVCFLYENMHKFDGARGTKAFSYFNVVARNWLIINAKKRSKDGNRSISIDDVSRLSMSDRRVIANHSIAHSPDDILLAEGKSDRIAEVLAIIEKRLTEEHEKEIMTSLKLVFQNVNDIDLLSKRAVFLYIREISGVDQKKLTSAMSVIRRHYKDVVKEIGGLT